MSPWLLFLVLTLAAYRLQRFVTTDDFPPSEAIRRWTALRFGYESSWFAFIRCPHCVGTWITFGVFAVAAALVSLPLPVGQALAAAALVGLIAEWGERPDEDKK